MSYADDDPDLERRKLEAERRTYRGKARGYANAGRAVSATLQRRRARRLGKASRKRDR